MKTFAANGKLLLTGEYLVLQGALALAIPVRLGQRMTVCRSQGDTTVTPFIHWNAYTPQGIWFSATLRNDSFEILHTDDQKKAEKLSQILATVRELNPKAFLHDLQVDTHLDFNPEWGLGSSSTLISNLARWAHIDPYELLRRTFGGSGYDIACATAKGPIFYQLKPGEPLVQEADLHPSFADNLFFVYQGIKQNSSIEVKKFIVHNKTIETEKEVEEVSEISKALPKASSLDEFQKLLEAHEAILSRRLDREPIKSRYPDFEGTIKSLGAWGGDFFLAATRWPAQQVEAYFHQKGLDIIFNYNDLSHAELLDSRCL